MKDDKERVEFYVLFSLYIAAHPRVRNPESKSRYGGGYY
jgi:hypothetical protein